MSKAITPLVLAALLLTGVVLALAACESPASGPLYPVSGRALAGPTCPVEPASPVPGQCEPRPVPDAALVVTASDGRQVARIVTAADGSFSIALAAGSYTLTPQPVAGLLTVAPPTRFNVSATDRPGDLRVEYDTGIR